jgi:hypothetical protein
MFKKLASGKPDFVNNRISDDRMGIYLNILFAKLLKKGKKGIYFD